MPNEPSGPSDKPGKWKFLDEVEADKQQGPKPAPISDRSLTRTASQGTAVAPHERVVPRDLGLVGRLRVRNVEQRIAVEAAKSHYEARLRVFQDQVKGMEAIAKSRTHNEVAAQLAQLDADYLKQLGKLDLEN